MLVHSWMKVVRLKGAGGNMMSLSPRPSGITISLHVCMRTKSSQRISTMEHIKFNLFRPMSSLCNFPKKFMNCPYNFVIIGVCGYLPCPSPDCFN